MKKMILLLALNWILPGFLLAQQTKIDSLEIVLRACQEDSNKVNTLNEITQVYLQVSPLHYRKALPVAREAQLLSEKISYQNGLAIACENLGTIYGYFGIYDKALENYLNELRIYESLHDSSMIIQGHKSLSGIYALLGDFKKNLHEAIFIEKWIETRGDKQKIAEAYWYVCSAYVGICRDAIKERDTGSANLNYSKVIEYAIKSLRLATELKDSADMGFYHKNLGFFYDKYNFLTDGDPITETGIIKTNYDNQALENDWKALKIYSNLNDSLGILDPYTNLALFYRHQGDLLVESGKQASSEINYKKSLEYYLKILTEIKKLGYKHGIANYSKEVGVSYYKLNNLISAQKFISAGAIGFQEIGFREGAKECFRLLSEVDFKKGDYKDAYENNRKFSIIKDSLLNEKKENQLTEMNVRFETRQKTDSIAVGQKLITLKNQSINRQHLYVIGLIVLIISISLLLVFTLFQSKKLRRQYSKIQQLQVELTHRTSNFFGSIKSMLTTAKSVSSDKETISTVEKRVNTINHLFKTLYASPEDTQIKFSEMLASICNDLENSFGQQNNVKIDLRSVITINKDEAVPLAFIITELVTNCYKHAFSDRKDGEIHILISEEKKTRTLDVWDNGNGLIEKELRKNSTQGMCIIKSYCKTLNGKFNYWNDDGFHFKLKF